MEPGALMSGDFFLSGREATKEIIRAWEVRQVFTRPVFNEMSMKYRGINYDFGNGREYGSRSLICF
jgi:hypothetical protein